MSDLISREWLLKQPLDTSNYPSNYVKSAPSADVLECARALKEYCEKHRNEHNFYMCETCEYATSTYSGYLQERTHKCPFNVPAHWDLPEGEKGGAE